MRDGRTVAVAAMADMTKLQLVATMLGRDLAEVRRKGATAFSGEAHAVGDEILRATGLDGRTAGQRCGSVDPQGRDRRARRAARLGPDRDRAGHLRGRSARAGRHRLPGPQAGDSGEPRRCHQGRHRVLFRGPQARGHHPGHVGAREPDLGAAAGAVPLGGGRRSAPAQHRRPLHQGHRHQVRQPRTADPRAVGRQPAEGAAGPLAVHESQAADLRRADARHRRRRQGRDPAADPRPWPRRGSAC